jgi:hypothetical protein
MVSDLDDEVLDDQEWFDQATDNINDLFERVESLEAVSILDGGTIEVLIEWAVKAKGQIEELESAVYSLRRDGRNLGSGRERPSSEDLARRPLITLSRPGAAPSFVCADCGEFFGYFIGPNDISTHRCTGRQQNPTGPTA